MSWCGLISYIFLTQPRQKKPANHKLLRGLHIFSREKKSSSNFKLSFHGSLAWSDFQRNKKNRFLVGAFSLLGDEK